MKSSHASPADRALGGSVATTAVAVLVLIVVVAGTRIGGPWVNIARSAVVLFGGLVAGLGIPICLQRSRQWRAVGNHPGARVALLLLGLNLLVMGFVTFSLFGHFDEPLTWRAFLALAIFAAKARLLYDLRLLTTQTPPANRAPQLGEVRPVRPRP